jgi:hypothetical protein
MGNRRKVHRSVTASRILELTESEMFGTENPGVCLACGEERDGCEPDARKYECYSCGERYVYGAAEILLMGKYHEDEPSEQDDSNVHEGHAKF